MQQLSENPAVQYTSWEDVFSSARQMEFHAFNTGRITAKLKTYSEATSIPEGVDGNMSCDWDVLVFSFKHPEKGDVLIDCGLSRSITDDPPYGNLSFIIKLFQKLNGVKYFQEAQEDFDRQIEKLNLRPNHVFLTHLHPDHTSGLPSLDANCIVYFGKKENSVYYRIISGNHLKGKEIRLLDFDAQGFPLEPFEKVIDVFGDGSILAISTPGHTVDHISYLINTHPTPQFILGDAELNRWAVENGIKINTDYGGKGRKDLFKSSAAIAEFKRLYPNVVVHYSHDK